MRRRLICRIGRRGASLLLLGSLVGLYGAGQLVDPLPDTRGVRLLLALAPMALWSSTWIAAGLIAVACAFRRDNDWPGFAAPGERPQGPGRARRGRRRCRGSRQPKKTATARKTARKATAKTTAKKNTAKKNTAKKPGRGQRGA